MQSTGTLVHRPRTRTNVRGRTSSRPALAEVIEPCDVRIESTADRRFDIGAGEPDIAQFAIIKFGQDLESSAPRQIGSEHIRAMSDPANDSAQVARSRICVGSG